MKLFPPELEVAFIDFCHADRATLASCGLVCRDWLLASRYHLFFSVCLTPDNVAAFHALAASAPDLQHLVREVQLRLLSASAASLPALVPIAMRLTRTTRLALLPAAAKCSAPVLAGVRLVHLKLDFRFESLRQIADCVCLCPQLESLELGGSWLQRDDLAGAPRPRRRCRP